jgi:vacuolar-type H+-ATPase subunit H
VHRDETTPHMHFAFVPITKNTGKKKGKKTAKEYTVSADTVISRKELKNFHSDLATHLYKVFGRDLGISNGVTQKNGGNKTISELKEDTKAECEEMKSNTKKECDKMIEDGKERQMRANEQIRQRINSANETAKKIINDAENKAKEIIENAKDVPKEKLKRLADLEEYCRNWTYKKPINERGTFEGYEETNILKVFETLQAKKKQNQNNSPKIGGR